MNKKRRAKNEQIPPFAAQSVTKIGGATSVDGGGMAMSVGVSSRLDAETWARMSTQWMVARIKPTDLPPHTTSQETTQGSISPCKDETDATDA